jgi:hypothetical protein
VCKISTSPSFFSLWMDRIDSKEAIIIGCLVGVLSSATQSIGLTLQRKSHIIEDTRPPGLPHRPAHRRGLWQAGVLLFVGSNLFGSSVQITTLPLIVLSPLQAIGLVFNSICASILLAEPFTRFSLVGTALVSIGALIIAAFGAIAEPHHNLNELLVLLQRQPFLIWMFCTILMVVLLLIAISTAVDRLGEKSPYFSNTPMLKGILYGGISGILSAHSLLMAKSAVELLVRGVKDRWRDYSRWQAWLIVALFLTFALLQLYFLNCGLKLCSTSVLYPLVFCIYNITTILNGLIYFQQTARLSYQQIFLVTMGTFLVLLGVLCLSWRLQHNAYPHRQSAVTVETAPMADERSPLYRRSSMYLIPNAPEQDESQEYTSFRSFASGGGIPEPGSPYSGRRPRRGRSMSLEQYEVLDQLRKK